MPSSFGISIFKMYRSKNIPSDTRHMTSSPEEKEATSAWTFMFDNLLGDLTGDKSQGRNMIITNSNM